MSASTKSPPTPLDCLKSSPTQKPSPTLQHTHTHTGFGHPVIGCSVYSYERTLCAVGSRDMCRSHGMSSRARVFLYNHLKSLPSGGAPALANGRTPPPPPPPEEQRMCDSARLRHMQSINVPLFVVHRPPVPTGTRPKKGPSQTERLQPTRGAFSRTYMRPAGRALVRVPGCGMPEWHTRSPTHKHFSDIRARVREKLRD